VETIFYMWKLKEQITVGTKGDIPMKRLRTRSQEVREGTYLFPTPISPLFDYGEVPLLNALMQAVSSDHVSATKLPLSRLLTGKYVTSRGHPFCRKVYQ
jgi:hypothetical protein